MVKKHFKSLAAGATILAAASLAHTAVSADEVLASPADTTARTSAQTSSDVKPALDAQTQVVSDTQAEVKSAQDVANQADQNVTTAQSDVDAASQAVKDAEANVANATPENIAANQADQAANLADQKANATETDQVNAEIADQTQAVANAQTAVATAQADKEAKLTDAKAKAEVAHDKLETLNTKLAEEQAKLAELQAKYEALKAKEAPATSHKTQLELAKDVLAAYKGENGLSGKDITPALKAYFGTEQAINAFFASIGAPNMAYRDPVNMLSKEAIAAFEGIVAELEAEANGANSSLNLSDGTSILLPTEASSTEGKVVPTAEKGTAPAGVIVTPQGLTYSRVARAQALPDTGSADNLALLALGGLMTTLGLAGSRKRRQVR